MKATDEILRVWKRFDDFPMETLTKAWLHASGDRFKPRSVDLMREQREQYGTSGNCFDLALWLIDELRSEGIVCYPVGEKLGTEDAHGAVIALDKEGNRYLCDLGDQWIQPILVDPGAEGYTEAELPGFFPGARIAVFSDGVHAKIRYIRPNGKESRAVFDLKPAGEAEFREAAAHSQSLLSLPLVERRMKMCTTGRIVHWEYERGEAKISSDRGLFRESEPYGEDTWARRISRRSGIDETVVRMALDVYEAEGLI
ncbi:hypothetical protein [Saccharibacillus endophyticus]|uniref:Uncharacterized protein n=1 Tax=Saccharibacillus endophyticus TaxID=2060666 RepID=A0ABQ1ZX69_9BACL|nr:hypothetical protein [Saccharibacillus endophyticus]GGH79321.1 hypothetical protein GCM10007362_25940 [Saccharibacillus endophyticus]